MVKRKAKVNSYEQVRKRRLEANLKRLQELGIMKISESLSEDVKSETKSVKRPATPKSKMEPDMSQLRRSSRARNPAISYVDEVQVDIGTRKVWRRGGRSGPSHDIRMASYEERVQAQDFAEKLQMKLKSGKPSFVKSMVASHVSSCFWLGLPTAFCKSYLPEKEVTMILEDENGSEFDVIYIGRRVGLSGGWKGFARAHKLNDGDALVFELTEPTRFKVYIIRASS